MQVNSREQSFKGFIRDKSLEAMPQKYSKYLNVLNKSGEAINKNSEKYDLNVTASYKEIRRMPAPYLTDDLLQISVSKKVKGLKKWFNSSKTEKVDLKFKESPLTTENIYKMYLNAKNNLNLKK